MAVSPAAEATIAELRKQLPEVTAEKKGTAADTRV